MTAGTLWDREGCLLYKIWQHKLVLFVASLTDPRPYLRKNNVQRQTFFFFLVMNLNFLPVDLRAIIKLAPSSPPRVFALTGRVPEATGDAVL